MLITASIITAVGAGIGGLIRWAFKADRKATYEKAARITASGQRLEAALAGIGLKAVWYMDSRTVGPPRAAQVGQIQIWVNANGGMCSACNASNAAEIRYVIPGSACGAVRMYIGECCLSCARFVAPTGKTDLEKMRLRSESWLKMFMETVHLEDFLEHLERGAAAPDAQILERRERELEGDLGDVRLRLQGLRAARGELADGPFRPRLVAGGEKS